LFLILHEMVILKEPIKSTNLCHWCASFSNCPPMYSFLQTPTGISRHHFLTVPLCIAFSRRPQGSAAKPTHLQDQLSRNPDHIGGYRLAFATFDGMESKLGLCLPKYCSPITAGAGGSTWSPHQHPVWLVL